MRRVHYAFWNLMECRHALDTTFSQVWHIIGDPWTDKGLPAAAMSPAKRVLGSGWGGWGRGG